MLMHMHVFSYTHMLLFIHRLVTGKKKRQLPSQLLIAHQTGKDLGMHMQARGCPFAVLVFNVFGGLLTKLLTLLMVVKAHTTRRMAEGTNLNWRVSIWSGLLS